MIHCLYPRCCVCDSLVTVLGDADKPRYVTHYIVACSWPRGRPVCHTCRDAGYRQAGACFGYITRHEGE